MQQVLILLRPYLRAGSHASPESAQSCTLSASETWPLEAFNLQASLRNQT